MEMSAPPEITRFAPSPSGLLHLGHAYSAIRASDAAMHDGGRFLLRIEDIDHGRCRAEFEDAIFEDLKWLGLRWEEPVLRQADRLHLYRDALAQLEALEVLYPCFCTRKGLVNLTAPHGSVLDTYAGTCRDLTPAERTEQKELGTPFSLRLDARHAFELAEGSLAWVDTERGPQEARAELVGDVILARKDIGTSYHVAVTVDDAAQGITLVTRGEDLLDSTHVHRLLQALLGLPVPRYLHHRLLTDTTGQRLAKRNDAQSIRWFRDNGHSPQSVLDRLANS